VLLEWDDRIPSFKEVEDEALRARNRGAAHKPKARKGAAK